MDRRTFLASPIRLLAAPLVAAAQPAGKVYRIGVLTFTQMTDALQEAFRQGLRDHGYMEGQNILVEWRAAEGRPDRAKTLAVELVALKVDIIVANLTPAVQAAKDATRTIPIVMASAADPVGSGSVASLAHPGGRLIPYIPDYPSERLPVARDRQRRAPHLVTRPFQKRGVIIPMVRGGVPSSPPDMRSRLIRVEGTRAREVIECL